MVSELSSKLVALDIRSKPREFMVASAIGIVGAQFLFGILEALTYRSTVNGAYESEKALRSGFFGAALAGFHYWASAAFLLVTMALLLEMVWNGAYKEPRRYYGALALAAVAFVFQLTGNLLPMDRHGVQTVAVEASISNNAPLVGHAVHNFMLRGSQFSGATLGLWWMAHAYLLPVAALVACALLARNMKAPRWAFFLIPAVVLVLGVFIHAPLGDAATQIDFSQQEAKVSWYTWPLHGMMGLAEKLPTSPGWIGSMLIPGLVMALLIALPWLRSRLAPHAIRLGVLVVGIGFLGVGATLGGPVAALTGNRDPAKLVINDAPAKAPVDPKIIELVKKGRDLFNAPTPGCADCHGKNGAKGDGGPDLTQDYKIHTDLNWYMKLIRNPKSVNSSSTMPAFPDLPDDQLTAIATFLSQAP